MPLRAVSAPSSGCGSACWRKVASIPSLNFWGLLAARRATALLLHALLKRRFRGRQRQASPLARASARVERDRLLPAFSYTT